MLDPGALLGGSIVEVASTWSDYGERSERERAAIGKAIMDDRVRAATCPERVSTMRTTGGGDEIYGDFEVVGHPPTELRSFEPGLGTVDPWTASGGASTTYYHGDLLGSTMGLSLSNGTGYFDSTYTAFGEKIVGTVGRYGYAGAWGYQAHRINDYSEGEP